jgi:SnoaL-like domain
MTTQAAGVIGQPAAVRPSGLRWLGVGALVIVIALVGGTLGWLFAGGAGRMSDESLVDRNLAAWSANNQAAITEQYAANAVFDEGSNHMDGAAAIAAYAASLEKLGFIAERTGPATRYGNYIVTPVRWGNGTDWSAGVGVIEVQDGKIVHHWVFGLPYRGS